MTVKQFCEWMRDIETRSADFPNREPQAGAVNIILEYVKPPIPDRRYDWQAYIDGNEEGPSGFGKTKACALRALADAIEGGEE